MDPYLTLKAKKRNLFVRKYKQSEDIITEAFIKMLEKSKPSITSRLLELLDLGTNYEDFRYALQVGNDILEASQKPIVLGIAESNSIIENSDNSEEGRPDAHIYTKDHSIHILLEVKVYNNQLFKGQLDRHSKRFANVGNEEIVIEIRTWDQIRENLNLVINDYEDSHRNYLLISEFLDLINQKEEYDIYQFLENRDLCEVYTYWHDYIKSLPDVTVKLKKDDSIDFIYQNNNFVTIFPKRGLLIFKPEKQVHLQRKINSAFGYQHFVEEGNRDPIIQHKKNSKEGIINVKVQNDINLVKEFIDNLYKNPSGE